ncbi:hypothetical protein BH11VER1_BH11VER1_40420 [soil metagenome]
MDRKKVSRKLSLKFIKFQKQKMQNYEATTFVKQLHTDPHLHKI